MLTEKWAGDRIHVPYVLAGDPPISKVISFICFLSPSLSLSLLAQFFTANRIRLNQKELTLVFRTHDVWTLA